MLSDNTTAIDSDNANDNADFSNSPPSNKRIHISNEPLIELPTPQITSAIPEAAQLYEQTAVHRNNDAQAALLAATDHVLACQTALSHANDRLRLAQSTAEEAALNCQTAREYVAQYQKLPAEPMTNVTVEKQVSFAPSTGPSSSCSSTSRRRKRIRAPEHGVGIYEGGEDPNGEPTGCGTVTWEHGGKYKGHWLNGKAHGHGVMEYANGDKYDGDWRFGSRFGEGTHYFRDGGVYCGQWKDDAPDGCGKMTLNGSHYEGNWKEGKWHGKGIVRPEKGGQWEGEFVNGMCITGTLRRPNGEVEIGRYDSVNPDDNREGVWWSKERDVIRKVVDGKRGEEIAITEAFEIAQRVGVEFPDDVMGVSAEGVLNL